MNKVYTVLPWEAPYRMLANHSHGRVDLCTAATRSGFPNVNGLYCSYREP